MILVGGVSLAIWLGLLLFRGGFWRGDIRDDRSDAAAEPSNWPHVTAIVPARDEAAVVAAAIGSLTAQDYPGRYGIILIDDGSSDSTADIARAAGDDKLSIKTGADLPAGWTGKLWAMAQGVEAAGDAPDYLLFTDADIVHAPGNLRALVARAEAGGLGMASLMARLRCESWAERALIPAFVFFFQMLYPFAAVNRRHGLGAAAGGCMLVRRDMLAASGGVAAIRGALIDDCALGAQIKRHAPIWLGLTNRAVSIRPYPRAHDVAAMIMRSAYAQLGYSPWLLAGTILGLALLYAVPPLLAVFGDGFAPRLLGVSAWLLMAALFQPMLYFYRRSPLWGLALPLIAGFYAGCTLLSAWHHYRGKGGMWKGRAQAALHQ